MARLKVPIWCILFISRTLGYLQQSEIDALESIYSSLGGEHWTVCSWNISELATDASLPSYYCGLTIDSVSDDDNVQNVVRFQFSYSDGNNLTGSFPDDALAGLSSLTAFTISNEPMLSGPFPNLCSLRFLQRIALIDTGVYGVVPECIGNTTFLTEIILKFTEKPNEPLIFNSSLISMWCSHQVDIHSLRLKRIDFIGPLPDCIGESFDNLFYFYFHDLSHFNSIIPSSMSMLTALQFLIFVDLPGLHGPFPVELLANNEQLSMLVLTDTSLSGNFSICESNESNPKIHKLNDLVISNNTFNPWTILQCIGNMNRLQIAQFSGPDMTFVRITGVNGFRIQRE